jgi:hypothetical protein
VSMAELTAATAAMTALKQEYHGKADEIDAKIEAKRAEVNAFLLNAANHAPLIRLSSNQTGVIDGLTDNLAGWLKNSAFDIDVSLVRTIVSGTAMAARPPADQAVLNAIGAEGEFFSPNINILKMTWAGWVPGMPAWTIMPGVIAGLRWCTGAAYSRRVAGQIGGHWANGITDEWGLTGENYLVPPGSYINSHPIVASGAGEIEFFWPALAAGFAKIDRENPSWGIIPTAVS